MAPVVHVDYFQIDLTSSFSENTSYKLLTLFVINRTSYVELLS